VKSIKRLFSRRKKLSDYEYEEWWKSRKIALEAILGPCEDNVHHSAKPLYLGGHADVLEFHHYVPGRAYVTADLIGVSGQLQSLLGNYELIICTRESSSWAPNIVSKLAKYTLDEPIQPGDIMDLGDAAPEGSNITGLLFTEPDLKNNVFDVRGIKGGLLLCIGITAEELIICQQRRSNELIRQLKEQEIFPYTDLARRTVR
jgi:hypothetical protein